MAQSQSQAIRTFVLGNKELEGKTAEFQYDHGWYSIFDIMDEQRSIVYKSKNAQEAYSKWNVYIGRKKERPQRNSNGEEQKTDSPQNTKQGDLRKERTNWEDQNRGRSKDKSDSRGEHQQHNRQSQRRHKNRQNHT